MAIFNKKEESFLGVDFGAGGIKLVELKKTKDRPQLWTYGIAGADLDIHVERHIKNMVERDEKKEEVLGEEREKPYKVDYKPILTDDKRIEDYGTLLKGLCEKSKITTTVATASLPVSYVFHAVVNLPKVEEKELEHHVSAKIKKMLPVGIEEMQVVHQLIPPSTEEEKKNYMKVLVTAAPKDLVLFYTSIFQKAGLTLEALETEAFALERSLVGKDKATSMIVDIGAERTNFFIVDQGLPVTHRSIQMGGKTIDKFLSEKFQIDEKNVSQIKIDMSNISPKDLDVVVFEPLVDSIVKEIKYGFDLFLHQLGNEQKRPEKIILTGGSAVFLPIVEILKKNFNMRVFIGDPWARVVYQQSLKPVLDNIGPRMSVAIGLALRNISG